MICTTCVAVALFRGPKHGRPFEQDDLKRILQRLDAIEHREDTRLERLEQSVDAIAIEVERVAEAQRFVSKLLAERSAADNGRVETAAQPGRVMPPR
jgi:hypothetical protein